MKRFFILLSILSLFFISCESEIVLEQKKDGSVKVSFSENSGDAIIELIKYATGSDEGNIVFDVKEIISSLDKNKFSQTKAYSKFGTDLSIETNIVDKENFLFSSGILKSNGEFCSVFLTEKNLVQFYKESDEQIVSFLDLLLAPVFCDEKMTENEYLEVISSFYGNEFAKELKQSNILFKKIDVNGNKKEMKLSLVELLTLNKDILF
jgi:hypothetical protein